MIQKSKGGAWTYLIFAIVLLGIGIAAPFVRDYLLWLKPINDSPAQWLERTGAITTIFGLLAINLIDEGIERMVPSKKLPNLGDVQVYDAFESSFSWIKRFAFVLTIVGTLIWGYGTVILNVLNRAA
ncbi:MAG: hypothetical protein C0439_00430 [Pseudomonas sp.]|nr:hypothetical protein [Pseudomonas sp.]